MLHQTANLMSGVSHSLVGVQPVIVGGAALMVVTSPLVDLQPALRGLDRT